MNEGSFHKKLSLQKNIQLKHLQNIILAILTVAVIILYVLHFKSAPAPVAKAEKKQSHPVVKIDEKPTSIVFVNTDSVMAHYNLVKDIKTESERERKYQETQFETRYMNFQKEVEDFKEKAPTMSQEQGAARQQELMIKEQQIGEFREKLNEQFMTKEQDRQDKLMRSITDYMDRNYNNTKYSYVLGYAHGGGILYANSSLNITDEVIDGLNAEYASSKKK
jgi:outer membrane protein